jgi:methionyl-tRNA formyltransferase
MKFVAIGRSQTLVESIRHVANNDHELLAMVTSSPAPEYKESLSELISLSEFFSVPLFKGTNSLAIKHFLNTLPETPDVAISVNHNAILNSEVIEHFRLGILNAHGGDLPRYRGNACQAWAIINGENKVGLCIHKMVPEKLDSGDIIERDFLPINSETYVGEIIDWIEIKTPQLFVNALQSLEFDASYVLAKQDASISNPLRCYPRNSDDGRINWALSAVSIDRLIKASGRPYVGAFSNYQSERVHIHRSVVSDSEMFMAIPGQVMRFDDETVTVATGQGAVTISDLKIEGQQVQVRDLVKSLRSRFTSTAIA